MNGLLTMFEISGDYTPEQHSFIIGNMPFRIVGVSNFDRSAFDIKEIPLDLSFEAIWKAYNHKIKKKAAQKIWEKYGEAQRIKVFLSLPAYEIYLKNGGIQKANLSTFLNGDYCDNEYN